MKKIISVILVMIMGFGTGAVAFAENQISVPEGYIGIYTAEDLNNIRNNLSGKYILMNDIDLSVYENWEPIGKRGSQFTGEFDGNGYLIKSLTMSGTYNLEKYNFCGLFGAALEAVLKNLVVVDAYVSLSSSNEQKEETDNNIGLICGYLNKSEMLNCFVSGTLTYEATDYSYVGSVVGDANNSSITRCSSYVDITVNTGFDNLNLFVGGITGQTNYNIDECSNFGKIKINKTDILESEKICVGGICGSQVVNFYKITNCYNRGDLMFEPNNINCFVGGINGISSILLNCYNSSEISIPDEFLGYCGAISANIERRSFESYPGAPDFERIENSYYINSELNPAYCEKVAPNEMNSVTREYTFPNTLQVDKQEMKNQNTFIGFDFENIWVMEENGYPVLKNQPTVTIKENIELVEGDVYGDKVIANEWVSTNSDVATVNENGEIVAVGAGEATITVEIAYGYAEEIGVVVKNKLSNCWIENLYIVRIIKFVISYLINIFAQ